MAPIRHTPILLLALILVALATSSLNANSSPAITEKGYGQNPTFRLEAKPPLRECGAGEDAKFDVQIIGVEEGDGSSIGRAKRELVFLRVEGLPLEWASQLSPRVGRTDFKSKLTIRTAAESPPGRYNITVVGVGFGGATASVIISVIIVEQPGPKPGPKEPYRSGLELTVRTDKAGYKVGDDVEIIGGLSTDFGEPVFNATIYLFAVNPAGRVIYFNLTRTDRLGAFYNSFKLTEVGNVKPLNGTYVIYATAIYKGKILRTHTTFILEYPSYPSVQIESILILNPEGNETKSMYRQGDSMKIKVTVTNYGMALDSSVVWVEIQAPNRIPIKVMLRIVPIRSGESKELIFDFKIPLNVETGIYYVKAYVSDRPISSGGRFIATGSETFIVES
jgi:hypothetical protein